MNDLDFLMAIREAILFFLDIIERKLNLSPRTSEIRKAYKNKVI